MFDGQLSFLAQPDVSAVDLYADHHSTHACICQLQAIPISYMTAMGC